MKPNLFINFLFRFLQILLISLAVYSAKAQETEQVINCQFWEPPIPYTCLIINARIHTDELPIRFTGNHLNNNNDSHVTRIIFDDFDGFINVLTKEFIQHFENLWHIHLDNCDLRRINADAFERCDSLEYLELRFNPNLTVLQPGLFNNCHRMTYVSFAHTGIQVLQANVFQGLSNLNFLHLFGTPFEVIAGGAFKNLSQLIQLELSRTNIEEINPEWFEDLGTLRNLNLNSNRISSVPVGIFDVLQNLQELHLNSNQLIRIGSFGRMPALTMIDMGNNRMDAIEPDFFTNFPVLHEFNSASNNCVNQRVLNVSQINFEEETVFDQCFVNWFATTTTTTTTTTEAAVTPSGGFKNSPFTALLTLTVFFILKL